jgi:hypothetical protein
VRERLDLLRLHPTYQRCLIDRRLTPSQAYEMSRLPEDQQHALMLHLEQGRAETYDKLRALVNKLLQPPAEQVTFGLEMAEEEKTVGARYDRIIQRLVEFVRGSFNPRDLKVLPRVVTSSLDVNIKQLDLIMAELAKIKKAMIQAQAGRDAAGKRAA